MRGTGFVPLDESIEPDVGSELFEEGEDGDGVGGGEDGAESECLVPSHFGVEEDEFEHGAQDHCSLKDEFEDELPSRLLVLRG